MIVTFWDVLGLVGVIVLTIFLAAVAIDVAIVVYEAIHRWAEGRRWL